MFHNEEIFEDLCSRFILNLPEDEKKTFRRLGFQLELAFWFYVDNYVSVEKGVPDLRLKTFCKQMCDMFPEILAPFLFKDKSTFEELYNDFIQYKFSVPCGGAIILNKNMDKMLMVKGATKKSKWGFPRGKINKEESFLECAVREVKEETGINIKEYIDEFLYIDTYTKTKKVRLFILNIVETKELKPVSSVEITGIKWHPVTNLFKPEKKNMYVEMELSFLKRLEVLVSDLKLKKICFKEDLFCNIDSFVFDTKEIMLSFVSAYSIKC